MNFCLHLDISFFTCLLYLLNYLCIFKSRNLDLHSEFMLVLVYGYILLYAFINLFNFQKNHSYPCFGSISSQQIFLQCFQILCVLPETVIPTRYPNCCHIERFKRAESVFDANFTRRHASRRVCAFSGCSIACTIYTELLFCLFIFYFILQDEIVI